MYKIGMTTTAEDLRYPVGRFTPSPGAAEARRLAIEQIAALPVRMLDAVARLNEAQLDTPYRPGGWTVRQVVHHVADSHMNGFNRIKLALTEENPTIKPYDEKAFAELADTRLPIEVSLDLLTALHARWVALYEGLREEQFARTFIHPDYPEPQTLDRHVQMYAWHSRHHVAHITALRARQGW
jgi:hypothetical protein